MNIQPEALKTIRSKNLQNVMQGRRRTHSFYAEYTDINPRFVRGRFTVHQPSQLERMQIGVLKSTLLGGVVPIDNMTDNLSHIMATLDVVLDEKPDWFDVEDPDLEYEILEGVFMEYLNFIESFRKGLGNVQPEGAGENTGGTVPVVPTEGVQVPTDGGQVS